MYSRLGEGRVKSKYPIPCRLWHGTHRNKSTTKIAKYGPIKEEENLFKYFYRYFSAFRLPAIGNSGPISHENYLGLWGTLSNSNSRWG